MDPLPHGENRLILEGSVAYLQIDRGHPNRDGPDTWVISWRISEGGTEFSSGARIFSGTELAAAFDLNDWTGDYRSFLFDKHGAHAAMQGKFIRIGKYLNIPGPGTGHDGDPNISIFVSPAIQGAVRELLGA